MAHDGDDYIEVICEYLTSGPAPAPPALFAPLPPPPQPVVPASRPTQGDDYIEFLCEVRADQKTPVPGPSGLQPPVRGTKREAGDALPEPDAKKSRKKDPLADLKMHFSKQLAKVFRRQSYQFECASISNDVAFSCCTLKSIRRLCDAAQAPTAAGNISPAYNKSSSEQSLFGSRFAETDDVHLLFVLHFLKRLELDLCLIVCGHWRDVVELHASELPLHKLDVLQIYDESLTVCRRKRPTHMLSVRLCRDNGQCAYGEKTISCQHLHDMLVDWRSLFRNAVVANLIFTSHKPIDDSILRAWQALLAEVSKMDVNCSLGEIQTDCEEWGTISPEIFTSYLLSMSLKDVNVSKVFNDRPCTFLNVFLGNAKIRRSSSVRIAFDSGVQFHVSQLLMDYVFAAKDAKNRDLFELSPWTAEPYFASAFIENFRLSEDTSHIPRVVRLHCVDESVGIEDIWPDAEHAESGTYYRGRVLYDAPPALDGSKLVVVFEGQTSDQALIEVVDERTHLLIFSMPNVFV